MKTKKNINGKRYMIISDPEGCPDKFVNSVTQTSGKILCDKQFYKELLKKMKTDRKLNIVFCGDYFDNGSFENIINTLKGIKNLKEKYYKRVIVILGNRDINKLRLFYETDFFKNKNGVLPDNAILEVEDSSDTIFKFWRNKLNNTNYKQFIKNTMNALNLSDEYMGLLQNLFNPKNKYYPLIHYLYKEGKIMEYDETNKILFSHAGIGKLYSINKKNQKIDSSYLNKLIKFYIDYYHLDISVLQTKYGLKDYDSSINKPYNYYKKLNDYSLYLNDIDAVKRVFHNNIKQPMINVSKNTSRPKYTLIDLVSSVNKIKTLVFRNIFMERKKIPTPNYFLLQAMALAPTLPNKNIYLSPISQCEMNGDCQAASNTDVFLDGNDKFYNKLGIQTMVFGHKPNCIPAPVSFSDKNRKLVLFSNDTSSTRNLLLDNNPLIPLGVIECDKKLKHNYRLAIAIKNSKQIELDFNYDFKNKNITQLIDTRYNDLFDTINNEPNNHGIFYIDGDDLSVKNKKKKTKYTLKTTQKFVARQFKIST
jgi:hypothetical protein